MPPSLSDRFAMLKTKADKLERLLKNAHEATRPRAEEHANEAARYLANIEIAVDKAISSAEQT